MVALKRGITDAAYDAISSQLLPRVRPDSIGSVVWTNAALQVQFTGVENCAYATQISSNLADWVATGTNSVFNGVFQIPILAGQRESFYRSVLVP